MDDFYFAYDYNPENNTCSLLCRHINHSFEVYNKKEKRWVPDNSLARIFIGEDIYYDEITEEQAQKIIENLN
ncbi:MAG TPA: hypothetical protein GXX36_03310 [Clostridiaceae bacterium]|nr:hypothetical protein [Clostridiaceae bacterium]